MSYVLYMDFIQITETKHNQIRILHSDGNEIIIKQENTCSYPIYIKRNNVI